MKDFLRPVHIEAFDLDDAWFRCLAEILDKGYIYTIERGSYKGQKRLEFDFVSVNIKKPSHQLIPIVPENLGIPAPTSMEYVEKYLEYIFTGEKSPQEDYTYGERLVNPRVNIKENNIVKEIPLNLNQIQEVIRIYKEEGEGTNQAIMEIGRPEDILLTDPPCLRLIDTRIRYGKLHFFIYFRSWDLWGGFPSNLAGLELLKQYMAEEIGVGNGQIIAFSKGLHLYEYSWEWAKIRTRKEIKALK